MSSPCITCLMFAIYRLKLKGKYIKLRPKNIVVIALQLVEMHTRKAA